MTILDSSVGIATRYGPDGPGVKSQRRAKFYAAVRTGPAVHPASYIMSTGLFPGVKRPRRGVNHASPSSSEVEEATEL
jgi:hypothetical protein